MGTLSIQRVASGSDHRIVGLVVGVIGIVRSSLRRYISTN